MKKIIFLFIIFPSLLFSQTHSLDTNNLEMTGTSSFNNISSNTYYNTIDSCNISWNIINTSIPIEWEVSFCFPMCYNIGETSGQESFLPNEQLYLGCHIYPNGKVGFGTVQMEITTDGIYKDTITWYGTISDATSINQVNSLNTGQIKQIYDISGRNINLIKSSGIYIFEYSNNTRKEIRYISIH